MKSGQSRSRTNVTASQNKQSVPSRRRGQRRSNRKGGTMKSPQSMGMNRTGMDMAPQGVEEMLQAVREFPPSSEGTEQNLSDLRKPYLEEADPIGSVPVPGTVKGVAKSGMQKLLGRHAEVLIDKLGGRLAFERTGTRLYDSLIGSSWSEKTRRRYSRWINCRTFEQKKPPISACAGMRCGSWGRIPRASRRWPIRTRWLRSA